MSTEGQPSSNRPGSPNYRNWLIVVVLMGFVILGGLYVFSNQEAERLVRSRPTARPSSNPFASFVEVRNDCGACGTDSPVGGWETEDGRSLILNEGGDFSAFFEDGTMMQGEWSQSGSSLCLEPSTGGETCFSYQQKVDAMKLDDGIYIRR